MPKETKKFINPLLRPSQPSTQEAEPKQEPSPRQERSAPAAREQASRVQTLDQEMEQEERSRPTSPTPPAPPTANDRRVSSAAESARQPASNVQAPTVSREPTRSRVTADAAKTVTHDTNTQYPATSRQENSAVEQAHTQFYEPQAETIRARPNATSLRPETPIYTPRSSAASIREAVAEPEATIEADESEEESDDAFYEESEIDFTSTTSKARRKRGEQAFEKTHVRFTVWVDKALKQSFDDIAIQREKPKTALLNEALADLVRKYEAH